MAQSLSFMAREQGNLSVVYPAHQLLHGVAILNKHEIRMHSIGTHWFKVHLCEKHVILPMSAVVLLYLTLATSPSLFFSFARFHCYRIYCIVNKH